MWSDFFLQNTHFALTIFVALVFLGIFWLYFDAWLGKKTLKESFKITGFFLLSISFFFHALSVEAGGLSSPLLPESLHFYLTAVPSVVGLILLIVGLVLDPPQPLPSTPLIVFSTPLILPLLYPFLSALVAILYLRRATTGLERHTLPIAIGFFTLTLSQALGLATLFRSSVNIDVVNLVAPFGPFWLAEHLSLLVTAIILGHWIFGYLLKRLLSQLFMILTLCVLVIFLATTVSFTTLLLKNLENEAVRQITTDARVLSYALTSKRLEVLATTTVLASDPQVTTNITATSSATRTILSGLTKTHLLAKKQSTLVIVNESGQVVAQGQGEDTSSANLSSDPLVKRALDGLSVSSYTTTPGVLAPQLSVIAASPILVNSIPVGAVIASGLIDNAFVDGIKLATGLESSIYGDDLLSATTLVTTGDSSRPLGLKLASDTIKQQVLVKGLEYTGPVTLLSTPYLSTFLPLTDSDNTPLGMLAVARPQAEILIAAGRSIQLTFVIAAALLAISIIPVYFISSYLNRQIH